MSVAIEVLLGHGVEVGSARETKERSKDEANSATNEPGKNKVAEERKNRVVGFKEEEHEDEEVKGKSTNGSIDKANKAGEHSRISK